MTIAPHWTDDFRVVPGSKQNVFVYHKKGKCIWKFENKDENLRDMHEAAWSHYGECKESAEERLELIPDYTPPKLEDPNCPLAYDPDNVLKLKVESVCISCGRSIRLYPDSGWVHWAWAAADHAAVPPLMLDPTRLLAYDAGNNVYILKVAVEDLNTIRNSLRSAADFLRGTSYHNTDADILSQRIEEEVKQVNQ